MAAPIRFSIRLPQAWCRADPGAITEISQAAEDLGFWGVSVQDHLVTDSSVSPCGAFHEGEDRNVLEALTVMSFVAARTTRVRLTFGVLVLPLRNPVWLAKELASLDVMSGGRVTVGVGTGAARDRSSDRGQVLTGHSAIAALEFDALGVQGHRGRRMDEYLTVLQQLWTQDDAGQAGDFVSYPPLSLYPRPVQSPHPPLWIGGRSDAALRRVARLGDAWFPSQATVGLYAEGRERIQSYAREQGRDAPADWGINLFAAVDTRRANARDTVRAALGNRFPDEELLFASTIAGSTDEVSGRITEYVNAGANVFDFKILPLGTQDTLDQLSIFAEEVMPRFI